MEQVLLLILPNVQVKTVFATFAEWLKSQGPMTNPSKFLREDVEEEAMDIKDTNEDKCRSQKKFNIPAVALEDFSTLILSF